jgi:glycosyltransferase involved in cell wall biosynthesis
MSICVVAPMLNEIRFVRAWCENVTRYADEIWVMNTGATDGTLDILRQYRVNIHHWLVDSPYRWPEAKIRNCLGAFTKCDWIVYQDADELVGQDFIDAVPDLQKTRLPFVRFPQLHFWHSLKIIRVRSIRSYHDWRHFYPNGTKVKMYRRGCTWVGGDKENGCNPYLQYKNFGRWSQRLCWYTDIPFFHLHYLYGLKENDLERFTLDGTFRHYDGPLPEEVGWLKA